MVEGEEWMDGWMKRDADMPVTTKEAEAYCTDTLANEGSNDSAKDKEWKTDTKSSLSPILRIRFDELSR